MKKLELTSKAPVKSNVDVSSDDENNRLALTVCIDGTTVDVVAANAFVPSCACTTFVAEIRNKDVNMFFTLTGTFF